MSFGKVESRATSPLSIGPQERIAYHRDLKPFLGTVSSSYGFGEYTGHSVKMNGYEDFNLILETAKGRFFIKCFADWRSKEDCVRYLEMIGEACEKDVRTPALYPNLQQSTLTTVSIDDVHVNLCAMQYLDGGNIWESGQPLNINEQAAIIREAAKINSCNYHPTEVEDSWAIPHISKNYLKNKEKVDPGQRKTIEDLIGQFNLMDLKTLPHAFVHGDIRSTNVMRHSDGKVYVIDFSVANYYPRIMELAVLLSDLLFNPQNPEEFRQKYPWALEEYQKANVNLTTAELEALPLFIKLAHAANVIGASSVDATNYISQAENDHWLSLGKKGLQFIIFWNPL